MRSAPKEAVTNPANNEPGSAKMPVPAAHRGVIERVMMSVRVAPASSRAIRARRSCDPGHLSWGWRSPEVDHPRTSALYAAPTLGVQSAASTATVRRRDHRRSVPPAARRPRRFRPGAGRAFRGAASRVPRCRLSLLRCRRGRGDAVLPPMWDVGVRRRDQRAPAGVAAGARPRTTASDRAGIPAIGTARLPGLPDAERRSA